MSKQFLNTRETAALTGVAVQTLCRWRCEGVGPPFVKAGRRVLYDRDDVLAWMAGQKRHSTGGLCPMRPDASALTLTAHQRNGPACDAMAHEAAREGGGGGKPSRAAPRLQRNDPQASKAPHQNQHEQEDSTS